MERRVVAGFEANALIDTDVLDALRDALQADRSKVRRVFSTTLTRNGSKAEQLRQRLSKEPPPAKHPIEWTSVRQRRAVMAKLRKQGNLPYQRTHRLSQGWRITTDSPLDVLISNSDPAAVFTQGLRQQKMHQNTGWTYAPVLIAQYAEPITDELVDAYLRFIVGYEK